MKNIVIIGAGQLGSRHLQALANCGNEYQITVIDPNQDSLSVAESRYNEVKLPISPKADFFTQMDALPKEIFAVIIATNSLIRRKVVEQLLQKSSVQYLVLEKFLFPSLEDYGAVETLLKEKGVKAFVNTPRRQFDYYNSLKQQLTSPFSIEINGVAWGLACNSVHYIDLLSYLGDDDGIESIRLISDDKIYESKRNGYIEFCGTMIVTSKNGNIAKLTCYAEGNRPLLLSISDSQSTYIIKESGNTSIISFTNEDGKVVQKESAIEVPRQSQLSNLIIKELDESGVCTLPSYSVSAQLHIMVLQCFLHEYRSLKNDINIHVCPIT
jgi:hypothetical protein